MRNANDGILPLDRRAALGLGVGAALALSSSAAAATRLDPDNPTDAVTIHRKLQYRTDFGLVFWWIKGPYFAQVDLTLIPMYGINFGVIQQVTQREDGGFDVKQLEMGFKTDVETGKRLTAFKNPVTGDMVPVEFSPIGPTVVSYSRDNVPKVPSDFGGSKAEFTPYPERPFILDGEMFLRHRARTRIVTQGVPDRIFNDMSTIYGPAAPCLDPRTTWVDAKLQSSDVTSWPRWLNMADKPGNMTLRGVGGKERRFADMPQDWLGMLHELAPDIARDPMAALERPQARFKN